jgi:hypothetical protein
MIPDKIERLIDALMTAWQEGRGEVEIREAFAEILVHSEELSLLERAATVLELSGPHALAEEIRAYLEQEKP